MATVTASAGVLVGLGVMSEILSLQLSGVIN